MRIRPFLPCTVCAKVLIVLYIKECLVGLVTTSLNLEWSSSLLALWISHDSLYRQVDGTWVFSAKKQKPGQLSLKNKMHTGNINYPFFIITCPSKIWMSLIIIRKKLSTVMKHDITQTHISRGSGLFVGSLSHLWRLKIYVLQHYTL